MICGLWLGEFQIFERFDDFPNLDEGTMKLWKIIKMLPKKLAKNWKSLVQLVLFG